MELDCKIQNYEWGKLGLNSKVASLYKNANQSFEVNENKPYAELWMGTHPNGPSQVRNAEKSLLSVIKENPDYLGSKIIEKFGVDLPYLFKVLSVNKALSIQVHPSKVSNKLNYYYCFLNEVCCSIYTLLFLADKFSQRYSVCMILS